MASHPPDEVRPGLFLGGYLSLPYAKDMGISAVLSVVNGDLSRTMSQDLLGEAPVTERLHVDLPDDAASNLLQHLPTCLDFITKNLKAGHKVLVHCAAGVSRSSAVVTSYVMVDQQMESDLALKYVQLKHPPAWPNQGFRYQLKLFEDMGCKLDSDYEPYRRYMLSTLTQQNVSSQESLPDPVEPRAEEKAQTIFRCCKCRTLLATSSHEVDAEAEAVGAPVSDELTVDKKLLDWRTRYSGGSSNNLAAAADSRPQLERQTSLIGTSVWLMPLRWMDGILGTKIQGKLYCPKCKSRLGSFNWSGMRSAGGRWVTPAFQLHGNNVDVETAGGLDKLSGLKIGLPRTARSLTPRQLPPRVPADGIAEAPNGVGQAAQGQGEGGRSALGKDSTSDTSCAAASAEAEALVAVESNDCTLQQPEHSRRAQAAADEAFARVAASCSARK